ncbi:PREDICTED: complement decay-accelerating factor [Hipposideros armiger]|uniref:Complement decay-accelerating factor n=1 Tax=Hipposideros armiger TaxID=186990 RepID=A0A8B7Q7U7_HIPAR|nr:PREDICTED: complement decay-accelerating factor [Hipposideros armiger]
MALGVKHGEFGKHKLSDCSLPPHVPNAQPDLEGRTSFPEGSTVTYKCNKDFVNVPGKLAAITCLKDNEWSLIAEFCNRSCDVPTRLLFAALKRPYNQQNYFPAGSVVEYECRRGYRRNHSLSGKVTCLQNFKWSKPDEFCEKTSCPNPGEVINGYVNITTDILFGASIIFSCKTGTTEIYTGITQRQQNTYVYRQSITHKESSHISKVTPQKPTTVNVPGTKVLSTLQKPSTVNIPGTEALSTPQKPATVKIPATEVPSTPQKPITVNASAAKAPLIHQKPTTVNVAAAEAPSTPWKTITANDSATIAKTSPVSNVLSTETPPASQTHVTANISATQVTVTQKFTATHDPVTKGHRTTHRLTSARITAAQSPAVTVKATPFNLRTTTSSHSGTLPAGVSTIAFGLVAGTILIGSLILVKIFWDYGKSGTCIYNSDSFAYDANNHWLIDLAKEDIRRKHTQVHRIFLVLYKFLEAWTQYMQYCSLFCTLPLSLRCTGISVK